MLNLVVSNTFPSVRLVLSSPLPVVCTQVAVFADTVRIVGSICVRALVRQLDSALGMVAILAHAFGVEGLVSVGTVSYDL